MLNIFSTAPASLYLRYSASFPIIVNVEGVETYFMVLKDGAGLIQRFAFANVKNYAKCVQAETIEKALEAYKKLEAEMEDRRKWDNGGWE